MRRILVLGSLNIDLVQSVPRLPRAGETIRGSGFAIHVGGKGANQACAAARLGGSCGFAGMLGADVFAARIRTELTAAGVDLAFVRESASSSGTASILVLPGGDNVIVIAPGANGDVTPELAVEAASTLERGDFLLCQLEIPMQAVAGGLREARQRGATTILDPAPAAPLSPEILSCVSILTPNQTEAALLSGIATVETEDDALRASDALLPQGPEIVIIKLGEAGCLIRGKAQTAIARGFAVKAVDTTAAGDTFNGALAVALAEGATMENAAKFANAAAAISVTRAGAIPSIPGRAEVDQLLRGDA